MKSFGVYLKSLRKDKMSQRELAEEVQVGYPYISKLENDIETNPSDQLLLQLARTLNIKESDMFLKAHRLPKELKSYILDHPSLFHSLYYMMQQKSLDETMKSREVCNFEEAGFRDLFMKSKKVMLLINPDTGGIEQANEAATFFYQYSEKELKNKRITDLNILPVHEIKKHMEEAVQEKRNYFQFYHRVKSGSLKKVQVYSDPLLLNERNYLHSIIIP